MIGFLRFVGLLNAAVWLGAAVFYTLNAAPALVSVDVQSVLGARSFPYFSGAIANIVLLRYFHLHFVCATLALIHVVAEWLYLGRAPRRIWTGLLVTLFWLGLLGSFWLGPKLGELHRNQYRSNTPPGEREAASKSFHAWQGVLQVVNVLMLAGVAVYFWRAAHPSDELRFVGSPKLRS